jgi:hypothetical protein
MVMKYRQKISRIRLLILFSLLLAASCRSPTDVPAGLDQRSMGSGPGGAPVASDYWYPHAKGLVIVYSNTDTLFNVATSSFTVTHGLNDTVKSLGYQGIFSPSGDSLFAVVATYLVWVDCGGRGVTTLRYLPQGTGCPGAFIEGSASISGETTTSLPASREVSGDSIAGALAGRLKSFGGSCSAGSKVWQKDTIYFTSIGDSVVLWNHANPLGPITPFKSVFLRLITLGDSWRIATDLDSSTYAVGSTSTSVTVPAGTYDAILLTVASPQYHLPLIEKKYFTQGVGLIRQEDSWNVTTDGITFNIHKLTTEASVIVKDDPEM